MTMACIKRIITLTDSGVGLNFTMLPPCLLTMLQLRRFTTLNAAGAMTVGIVVRNNTLLNHLVQHNSFVDTLKGYLDDDNMQTRGTIQLLLSAGGWCFLLFSVVFCCFDVHLSDHYFYFWNLPSFFSYRTHCSDCHF